MKKERLKIMKTKKLHELIELAEAGVKFKAKYTNGLETQEFSQKYFLGALSWRPSLIKIDWEYHEIREPEVVEFDCYWIDNKRDPIHPTGAEFSILQEIAESKKRWKVTCTEIVE